MALDILEHKYRQLVSPHCLQLEDEDEDEERERESKKCTSDQFESYDDVDVGGGGSPQNETDKTALLNLTQEECLSFQN